MKNYPGVQERVSNENYPTHFFVFFDMAQNLRIYANPIK